ncbi:MAG: endonuclease/exonuclease/phosphatase family protein [Burkholderiaceae bacterium]
MSKIAKRLLVLALVLLVSSAALASLIAKSASAWWLADLAVHFKLQYLLIGALCIAPALWLRRWILVSLCLLCIIVNTQSAAQYFAPAYQASLPTAQAPQGYAQVRLASLNVWFANVDYDGVAAWIEQTDPDIVVLVEVNPPWQKALAQRLSAWPHQHYQENAGRTGKLILSKTEPLSVQSISSADGRPPLLATLYIDGATLRVGAVHTHWPIGARNSRIRNKMLGEIAKIAQSAETPFIAAGDFNVSPFSPHFQSMLSDGGLRRASAGRGWQPTWPHFLPIAGIEIDHVLVPRSIAVTGFSVHKGLGSDHHGIVADLDIPRR